MATYWEIQKWVKANHGFVPKTCWIAHMKELEGLNPGRAPNRQGLERVHPCPENKKAAIKAAFDNFMMAV